MFKNKNFLLKKHLKKKILNPPVLLEKNFLFFNLLKNYTPLLSFKINVVLSTNYPGKNILGQNYL